MRRSRTSRKRGNYDRNPNDDDNILYHKQGDAKPEISKKLQVLESLRKSEDIVTCCNFGVDSEKLFINHFFATHAKIGRIGID